MTYKYPFILRIALLLLFSISCNFLYAQEEEIPADLTRWVTPESRANWLELNNRSNFSKDAFLQLLNLGRNTRGESSLNLENSRVNKQGRTRHVYRQFYKGVPVEHQYWVLHERNSRVELAQGRFLDEPTNNDPQPILQGTQAFTLALDSARAKTYAWQVEELEENLQLVQDNPNATYFPEGNLVWIGTAKGKNLELAYKFDIYSVDPISRKAYYINAKTGQLIKTIDLINTGCFANHSDHLTHTSHQTSLKSLATPTTVTSSSTGTGIANYINTNDGIVDIETQFDGSKYSLYIDNLGPSGSQVIHTKNANNFWYYNNLTDFTDADNHWDTDTVAVGTHWGTQQVYNYYLNTFGRESFDNEGSPMIGVVHYGSNLVNAFWDGTQMTYGDGNGTEWGPLTSLDIIAHEFTHGVTENNGLGGLVYLDDSGALNESFSDIFGAVVEFAYHPDGGDWLMGEDFDLANHEGFRNLANPHTMGHPKTYLGVNWYDQTGDNGGVHINSSVQNYWFYLLSVGGSGTNEFGQDYDITPIGMEKAAAIAYETLTEYLLPNATYQNARDNSILAAIALYGSETGDVVREAWCAVGLGSRLVDGELVGCGPTITITAPTNDETVTAGKNYTLSWTSNLISTTSKVKIEYTIEEGDNPAWKYIADAVKITDTYDWLVPSDYSNTARIRVTDDGDPGTGRTANIDILGVSDPFVIEPCIGPNSFTSPDLTHKGETIDFESNITGNTYEWIINGQTLASTKDYSHTFTEAGIYEITYIVTNDANNCFNKETKRVYVVTNNTNGFAVQVGDLKNNVGRAYSQEILRTKDGGYIFASIFTSMAFKIDALGNLLWSTQSFPSPAYPNYRLAATETANGNILIALGNSASNGATPDDHLMLIEVNGTNGRIVNNGTNGQVAINTAKKYSLAGRLMPYQIIATADSYLIGGSYQVDNGQDVFLLKLDTSDLSITDQAFFGDDDHFDYYGDLSLSSDGGYVLGWIQTGGPSPSYFAMTKLDADFEEEWREGISSYRARPSTRSRMKIEEIPECGGYMVLADSDEYENSILLRLNELGNVIWAKRYIAPESMISFQDMVWDGNEGVTLLGVNGTKLNSNAYPESVNYQVLNVGFDGQMNWKRKVADLDVIIPTFPSYNLYVTKLLLSGDGGYLAAIPGGDGGETHLIKMDSFGLDGCVMEASNITEEDVSNTFSLNLAINNTHSTTPNISVASDLGFSLGAPIVTLSDPKCGNVGNTLVAAFCAEEYTLAVGTAPDITNLSRGASSYTWKIDGDTVSFPVPIFNQVGSYQVTLDATDGTAVSSVSFTFSVIESDNCYLPCDLTFVRAYTNSTSCPDAQDAELYSEVTSPSGRNFVFSLYDNEENLLITQATGFFRNLANGSYRVEATAINDDICVLDLGTFVILPKVDSNPPQALCPTSGINAAFVHAAIGVPYNHGNYVNEMTAALGQNWHQFTYETLNPLQLFSDTYSYIYLEGSDNNANELEAFMADNQTLVENWVALGNVLFINAGPNEGGGMNLGFGGVQIVIGAHDTAYVRAPNLPFFSGPRIPTSTGPKLAGYPFSKAAVICPPGMDTTRVLASRNGTDLLVLANWPNGNGLHGKVLFGGMNLTGFHTPGPETYSFKINIHNYLKDLSVAATRNSPIKYELNDLLQYNMEVSEIDLGSFDDCGSLEVMLDKSAFTCTEIGVSEVVLIATDLAGNTGTCTTSIEILDPNDYCNSTTLIEETICQGETFRFNGMDLSTTQRYKDTLQTVNQTDSFIVLDLIVLDTSQTLIDTSICHGTTYSFNGQNLASTGIYRDTFATTNSCDSFIVLNLTVLDTIQNTIDTSICQGNTYAFNNQDLASTGIYRDTIDTGNSCDRFIVLNLTVLDTVQTQIAASICEGDSHNFNGQMLTGAGIYQNTMAASNGCDSIIVLSLSVTNCGVCTEDYMYLEDNPMPKGTYQAITAIGANSVIVEDTVAFKAGQEILLEPGFYAPEGSVFSATIEACAVGVQETQPVAFKSDHTNNISLPAKDVDLQVFPNPFSKATTILFTLKEQEAAQLNLYSLNGTLVKTILPKNAYSAGVHEVVLDASDLEAGFYYLYLQTDGSSMVEKVVVQR